MTKYITIDVPLVCELGHKENGHMIVLLLEDGHYLASGGSSWDFCDRQECSWRSDESREAGHRLAVIEIGRKCEELGYA